MALFEPMAVWQSNEKFIFANHLKKKTLKQKWCQI